MMQYAGAKFIALRRSSVRPLLVYHKVGTTRKAGLYLAWNMYVR